MQSTISFGSVVLEPSDFFSLLVRQQEGLLAVNAFLNLDMLLSIL